MYLSSKTEKIIRLVSIIPAGFIAWFSYDFFIDEFSFPFNYLMLVFISYILGNGITELFFIIKEKYFIKLNEIRKTNNSNKIKVVLRILGATFLTYSFIPSMMNTRAEMIYKIASLIFIFLVSYKIFSSLLNFIIFSVFIISVVSAFLIAVYFDSDFLLTSFIPIFFSLIMIVFRLFDKFELDFKT